MSNRLSARAGRAAAVVAAAGLALAGFSGVRAGAAAAHQVSIVDFSFSPRSLTVEPGDTVAWTNDGSVDHTVTADDGSFDSGAIAPGQSFSHTFPNAGAVPYHCRFHGAAGGIGMAGTITVQGALPATTTPPATAPRTVPPAAPAPGVPAAPGQTATGPGRSAAPVVGQVAGSPVGGTTAAANDPPLPRTGSRTTGLILLAAGLLLAGTGVVLWTRRGSGIDHGS